MRALKELIEKYFDPRSLVFVVEYVTEEQFDKTYATKGSRGMCSVVRVPLQTP